MQALFSVLMELKVFILLSSLSLMVIFLFAWQSIQKSHITGRRKSVFYAFSELHVLDAVYLGFLYLEWMFMISVLVARIQLQQVHVFLYAGLCLVVIVSANGMKNKGYLLVNLLLQGGFLSVLSMLQQYARLLSDGLGYWLIYVAGSICLVLYGAYVCAYAYVHWLDHKRVKTPKAKTGLRFEPPKVGLRFNKPRPGRGTSPQKLRPGGDSSQ